MIKHHTHDLTDVPKCILIRAILKHGIQKLETRDRNTETGIWNPELLILRMMNETIHFSNV